MGGTDHMVQHALPANLFAYQPACLFSYKIELKIHLLLFVFEILGISDLLWLSISIRDISY